MELSFLASEELAKLTASQLREHIEPHNARLTELADADKTLAVTEERVKVRDYVNQVSALVIKIETAEIAEPVDIDAAIADATTEPAAPVEEAPAVETPVEEALPADAPVVEESKIPVSAVLDNLPSPTNPNPTTITPDAVIELHDTIQASLTVTTSAGSTIGGAIDSNSFGQVAERIRHVMKSKLADVHPVAALDRFGGHPVPRLKEGDEFGDYNTTILNGGIEYPEPIQAILCGQDTELDFGDQCTYRTDTPFWDSFGRGVAADACGFRWRKHMSPEDFKDGTAIWDACKQAAIDPCDEATWKPLTNLPDCTDMWCTAKPFYVTWGLGIEKEDEFCRPEMIAEANRMLAAYRAKRLEEAALYIADSNSDLKAVDLTDPMFGNLGVGHSLALAITMAVNPVGGKGRLTCPTNYTAYIHEYFVKLVALDMLLAGEQSSNAEGLIRDAFQACGINDLRIIADYGCEGQLVDPYVKPESEMVCEFNCNTEDLAAINCAPLAFGAGEALQPLNNAASIRLIDNSAFAKAETGVVDYTLRQDTRLIRQNRAEYFGESRHFLFPTVDKDHMRLDVKFCVNGNRIRHDGTLDCGLYMADPAFTQVITVGNPTGFGCGPTKAVEAKTVDAVAVTPETVKAAG